MGGRLSASTPTNLATSQPMAPPPPMRQPTARQYSSYLQVMAGGGPTNGGPTPSSSSGPAVTPRGRATSLTGAAASSSGASHRGFSLGGLYASSNGGTVGSPNSDDSTPGDDAMPQSRAFLGSSLPVHLFSYRDIKCPVCSKMIPPDDVECHLVMCLTRPRITYNEDVLSEDKDECVICLEELRQGDTIARLPCLCIYHKSCIDDWFKVNRSCPEHPVD